MKSLYRRVVLAVGVLSILSGCGESPVDTLAPSQGERSGAAIGDAAGSAAQAKSESAAIEEEATEPNAAGNGLQWEIVHTGQWEAWMQQEFDAFRQSIDGLTSSDPAVAEAAFGALMARDPNFYPAVVRALTEKADDATKAMIEECIQAYWDEYGGAAERGPGGGGGEVTTEVKGTVTIGPGSKVTIKNLVHDIEIDVSGPVIPINVGESAHDCQHRVATSRTRVKGIRVPISFTLPGWGPVTGIKIELVLIIDITTILRYYECEEPRPDLGDRELLPQWDRVSAITPARF